jgi:uncharacterized Zn-finger protein
MREHSAESVRCDGRPEGDHVWVFVGDSWFVQCHFCGWVAAADDDGPRRDW